MKLTLDTERLCVRHMEDYYQHMICCDMYVCSNGVDQQIICGAGDDLGGGY